ncbi:MAG TPA: methyltransferase domain-containing protein [Thermoanaerobaculia bacterium]|nr:methyltransferase domain-containing protein [Thermoanaerobaculia bacterium]
MTADADLVRAVRERAGANDSVFYAHRVFAETDGLARRHGLPSPRSVLEIGPGANLGSLFAFAASGARATGVDVAPLPPRDDAFYEALRDYLLVAEGFAWWRAWAEPQPGRVDFPTVSSFPSASALLSSIDYRSAVSSESLPFPAASFDLVYSVAALEHVPDPQGTVDEIARVLAPGGLAVHEIDLKHHGSDDPLRFLELEDEEWRRRATRYGDVSLRTILDGRFSGEIFCNRLRSGDWRRLFESAGLAVERVEPVIVLDASAVKPERFAAPFRNLPVEELSVLAIRVVGRKAA